MLLCMLVLTATLFSACNQNNQLEIEKGVSKKLNEIRNHQITDLEYDLYFSIPSSPSEIISGSVKASFNLVDNKYPVVFDFSDSLQKIKQVTLNGTIVEPKLENGHIVIPANLIQVGKQVIDITFQAGDQSLNRNDEFLYTLFVPDRASSAFPCFDQPSMKAAYKLSLEIPNEWVAVANGELIKKKAFDDRSVYQFAKTEPISTYLFAFTAGKFTEITREQNGRSITLYHRETEQERVKQNLDEIFRLQFDALEWMEDYTQIEYPFGKYDLVAIPSFQYSGMEHPGAVLYRAQKLFLDATATNDQILSRASLIAHETAHMWFGDLVTMAWFDDVWMKEVFANFMAAKIVNPAFPDVDHKLAFLIDHYPKAYAIDRTKGANPIKQNLENMNMAGTLYGSIIYHKAPIVMQHLENITGTDALKAGLQEYLNTYAFANADWNDLINILDTLTKTNLEAWSSKWVNEAGMPVYETNFSNKTLTISQDTKSDQKWAQQLNVLSLYGNEVHVSSVFDDGTTIDLEMETEPDLVLLNGSIVEYGYFKLTENDLDFFQSGKFFTMDVKQRTAAYISLWENMLRGNIELAEATEFFRNFLINEENEQAINLLLTYYPELFWRYTNTSVWILVADIFEPILWDKMIQTNNTSLKSAYYKAYINTAYSTSATKKISAIWKGELKIEGLALSTDDFTKLSFELAVRAELFELEPGMENLLLQQLNKLENPDKKKRMAFIIPALSNDEVVREHFFESLKNPSNRTHEPWVLTGLKYLHHPLRAEHSEEFVLPSLDMLEEIQVTGDIFFPKGWLDATFNGHRSNFTADQVSIFLNNNKEMDIKLRQKVLQSTDPLFRAVQLSEK